MLVHEVMSTGLVTAKKSDPKTDVAVIKIDALQSLHLLCRFIQTALFMKQLLPVGVGGDYLSHDHCTTPGPLRQFTTKPGTPWISASGNDWSPNCERERPYSF
jgi:hypothetical protein